MNHYVDTKLHLGEEQPPETICKMVMYRPYQGHWHAPYFADQLNWKKANIGTIHEYRIVK